MNQSGMLPCKIREDTSAWLDWARAIAAFLVFAGHCRAFCFLPATELSFYGKMVLLPFYFITGLGHQAVVVFFVLSGYLVGGSVLKEVIETGTIDRGRYAISRIVRIHSVLVVALLLGVFLDLWGINGLHASGVYSQSHFHHVLFWDVSSTLSLTTFFGNLACLQTILVPCFGSNGPLWSLANEFWYYFLFPALLLAFWKGVPMTARILAFGSLVFLLWLLGAGKLLGFLIWLAGAGVRLCPPRVAPKFLLGGAAFLAAVLLVKSPFIGNMGLSTQSDTIVALGFCVLLLSISHHPAPSGKTLSRWGKQFSAFSYTLYACHFPLVVFLAAWANTRMGAALPLSAAKLVTWACYAGFILVVTFICWALSLVSELQYHRLRNWLLQRLRWAKPAA